MSEPLIIVDHSTMRTNQAVIILLLLLAFIFNVPLLVTFTAVVILIGTGLKKPGFLPVYNLILLPFGLLKPEPLLDNLEPHCFAQGFGGVMLVLASISLTFGSNILGWTLVWLVIALAALNLFVGFCVGCAVYYWFNRLNVPGFNLSPPTGFIPGMRPKTRQ